MDLGFADTAPTVVRFYSSDPSAAQVPTSITIPAGQTTGTFTITSSASAPPTIVQIMGATPDDISRTHNLSVNAATPAGPSLSWVSFVPTSIVAGQNATGTVRFSRAMKQGAVVQLTSSNPNAILSVYSSAGNLMFDLTNKGGGRYADQRGFIDNPRRSRSAATSAGRHRPR